MSKIFDNITTKNKIKLLRLLKSHTLNIKKDMPISPFIQTDNIIGIIIKGYIEIIRTDHNGNVTIIEELEEEDIFGTNISSLKNKEYDMIAKEDSEIIIIDYKEIIDCKENNKSFYIEFTKNLLQIFTNKIAEKNEHIEVLTKKTIRNKLLEYFSITAQKHNSSHIYLPFTFKGFADYLGVDRSAMSRELKNLKDEGFIETKGRRITLLNNDIWLKIK